MSVSLGYLERCAADSGFQPSAIEKVIRLGELAADVGRHPLLQHALVLKGGTALNLAFGAPQRLSVDLDFNYIAHADRERMLEDRPRMEAALADLARRRSYTVQRSADAFAGRKLYLSYPSVLGPQDRIEIDLNFLFRIPLTDVERHELWQPGDLDRPEVAVVGRAELLIGKLLALLDRAAARDAWDVGHLPAPVRQVLESSAFRPLFVGLSSILIHPLPEYSLARIEQLVTDKVIVEQLRPMLVAGTTARASDLTSQAWAVVAPFLDLAASEREFVAGIGRGEIHADLLFPREPDAAVAIAGHPAILWKVTNVLKHLAKKNTRS